MKITLERTGGFSAIRLSVTLDTETIPKEEGARLSRMVEEAALFRQPSALQITGTGADQFCYRLTVDAGGDKKTVEMAESAVPEIVRPLLRYLIEAARTGRRRK